MAADNASAEHRIGAAWVVDTPKFGELRKGKPRRVGLTRAPGPRCSGRRICPHCADRNGTLKLLERKTPAKKDLTGG